MDDTNIPKAGSPPNVPKTDLCRWSRQTLVEVTYSYSVQQDLVSPGFGIGQIMVNGNCDLVRRLFLYVYSLYFPPTIPKGPTCIIPARNRCSGHRYIEEDIPYSLDSANSTDVWFNWSKVSLGVAVRSRKSGVSVGLRTRMVPDVKFRGILLPLSRI